MILLLLLRNTNPVCLLWICLYGWVITSGYELKFEDEEFKKFFERMDKPTIEMWVKGKKQLVEY